VSPGCGNGRTWDIRATRAWVGFCTFAFCWLGLGEERVDGAVAGGLAGVGEGLLVVFSSACIF